MAGPGDEIAAGAGGCGHLRASHADREQVIDTLKVAFVQGMLAKDEFDLRVGQAFVARTYADLAAVTADLAAKPTVAQPSKPAAAEGKQPVLQPGPVIRVASVLYAVVWLVALLVPWPKDGDGDPMGGILLVFSPPPSICSLCSQLWRPRSPIGGRGVLAGSHRSGQGLARTIMHPRARH